MRVTLRTGKKTVGIHGVKYFEATETRTLLSLPKTEGGTVQKIFNGRVEAASEEEDKDIVVENLTHSLYTDDLTIACPGQSKLLSEAIGEVQDKNMVVSLYPDSLPSEIDTMLE